MEGDHCSLIHAHQTYCMTHWSFYVLLQCKFLSHLLCDFTRHSLVQVLFELVLEKDVKLYTSELVLETYRLFFTMLKWAGMLLKDFL